MKIFTLLLFFILYLHASHINWTFDYETARKQASNQHKNLLILLIDKIDNQSKNLLQNNFINQTYIKDINKNFISILILKNQKSSYPIELLYTQEYPTLFLLDKEELELTKPLTGIITPKLISELISKLK